MKKLVIALDRGGYLEYDNVSNVVFEGEWLIFEIENKGYAIPARRIHDVVASESTTHEL